MMRRSWRPTPRIVRYMASEYCWGSGSSGSAFFGPPLPGSGSISQRSGSRSFSFLMKVLSRLKKSLQNRILTQNFSKNLIFKTEDGLPAVKLKEKIRKKLLFFSSLKSLKNGVGSGVEFGSGSIIRGTDPLLCF